MEAKAKQKLIEALRSGKYRQIRGSMSDGEGGYCVLGLASHLGLEIPDQAGDLVMMNDGAGLTFEEIATRIEAGDFHVSSSEWRAGGLFGHFEPAPDDGTAGLLRTYFGLEDDGGDDDPPTPVLIFVYPRKAPSRDVGAALMLAAA